MIPFALNESSRAAQGNCASGLPVFLHWLQSSAATSLDISTL